MDQGCISFDIGKLNIGNGDINFNFNEHRQICHKGGNVSFQYGKMINNDNILLVGHSIIPEQDIKKYKFVVITYKNDKKIKQETVDYQQILDLFQKDNKSKLLTNMNQPAKLTYKPKVISKPKNQKAVSRPTVAPKVAVKLLPGKKNNHVINPLTGKEIAINGPTYTELCSTGAYIC